MTLPSISPQRCRSRRRYGGATSWVMLPCLMSNIQSALGAEIQPSLHQQVIGILNTVNDSLYRGIATVATTPIELRGLQADAIRAWQSGEILRATTYCLVLLIIGGGAEWLYWCYAGKAWRAIAEAAAAGNDALLPTRAAALGLRRAALSAFAGSLFAAGVLVPSSTFSWPSGVQAGIVATALAITEIRALCVVSTFILSPHSARLRLVAFSTRSARRLNLAIVALGVVFAGGFGAQSLLLATLGMAALAAIASAVSGVVAAGLSLTVLRFWLYAPGTKASSSPGLRPVLLTILVLACLALHLLGAREIVGTMLLWVVAIIVGATARPFIEAFTVGATKGPHRAAEYQPVLRSGVRIVVFGAATAATATIWGIPLLQLSQSDTLMGRFLARGFDVIVVALIAELIWVWTRTIIDGRLVAISALARENGVAPSARLATLLPLFRKAVFVLLVGLVSLVSLSALGVDVAPLLAGAGVVGIAIGLGAQTLVRDVVSGVFYLLADSFRVGEWIEFGDIQGRVEGISLRFLRIRHHRGAIYTVPFGEIKWLVNFSRDWAVLKLEFRVPFETDIGLVKRIVEKIGTELMSELGLGLHIIKPLESLGVIRMEEFGMVMGAKCTTKPDEGRFVIRREAFHRIRDAFAEHGILLPQRNAKVEAPSETNVAERSPQSRADTSSPDGHESAFEHEIAFELRSPHHDHAP
jgi:moderate conductance mechanosensitive channel